MSAADRLIVALDAATASEALRLAKQVRGVARTVKIGSALFTACGPSVIARIFKSTTSLVAFVTILVFLYYPIFRH